ncbi:MAG: methyl-accepting chemotaxis protein [Pirellulales bacterium]
MKNAVANSECSISSIVTAVEQIALAVQEISNETQTSTNLVNETVSRTQESERQVLSLLETTQSIGQVLSLIDSVAAKINMLALNATIEAARAGEAGKGFAVVAGEVKTLAKQTSQATTTIKETITNVQAISEQVIHSLHSLSEAVTRVNDSCHSIASATEEQTVILSEMATQAGHVSQEFSERDQTRLIEMAQTLVQLIVRNLYERTADVRWWATDKAFTTLMGRLNDGTAKLKTDVEESKRRSWFGGLFSRSAAESKSAGSNLDEKHKLLEYAKDRLAIINRFYSVYLDLVLADRSGKIVACSNPAKVPCA